MKRLARFLRLFAEAIEDLSVFYQRLKKPQQWSFVLGKNLHSFSEKKYGKNVDIIIDVGANEGQFATMARFCWPKAEIVSSEPDPSAASKFINNHKFDKKIRLHQIALGSSDCKRVLNISENTAQNSFLQEIGLKSKKKKTTLVKIKSLDKVFKIKPKKIYLLKLDVQGFELEVIRGAKNILNQITFILVEISVAHMYENGAKIEDVWRLLRKAGFIYYSIVDQYRCVNSACIQQIDVLFIKKKYFENK